MYEHTERRQELIERLRYELDIPSAIVDDDEMLLQLKNTLLFSRVELAMSLEPFKKEFIKAIQSDWRTCRSTLTGKAERILGKLKSWVRFPGK